MLIGSFSVILYFFYMDNHKAQKFGVNLKVVNMLSWINIDRHDRIRL